MFLINSQEKINKKEKEITSSSFYKRALLLEYIRKKKAYDKISSIKQLLMNKIHKTPDFFEKLSNYSL